MLVAPGCSPVSTPLNPPLHFIHWYWCYELICIKKYYIGAKKFEWKFSYFLSGLVDLNHFIQISDKIKKSDK